MSLSSTNQYDPDQTNALYVYVRSFTDELQRSGLGHVVVCPGSRSTPLALALAQQPEIRVWMHVDERSAAFFALGLAKKLHQPVGLVCTSGTAAANFFPAIVEAKLTHIPLLVLTADRPHELRECGAPQAIDQNRLYGSHVKWFMEVGLPEATNASLRYIRTLANRAVAQTLAVPAGPVHLNLPFREPLTPQPGIHQVLPAPEQRDTLAWFGRSDNVPYVKVNQAVSGALSPDLLSQLMTELRTVERGLILVGPLDNPALKQPLLQLAHVLGYPVLADPLSQLRSITRSDELDTPNPQVVSGYDALLRVPAFVEQMEPQLVLRFGAMPVSKSLLLYLKRYAHCPQIVIDGHHGWDEPTQLASEMLHIDPVTGCQQLLSLLVSENSSGSVVHPLRSSSRWLSHWQKSDIITRQALQDAIAQFDTLFEGRVFTELAHLLPEKATLFAGNSMPVRDMDSFLWKVPESVHILGNRGANGIDGVISTALGCSAAAKVIDTVSQTLSPTVLVIGDLSFYHDLNGLLAARLHQLDLTIILVNNDGGGIFSFLPQSRYPDHFEQLFGTPTGLNFQPVVEMYGGCFQRVVNWQEFRKALHNSFTTGGLHVIEVPTERDQNVIMHGQLWQAVEQMLQKQEY